jgi:hypothetical protein
MTGKPDCDLKAPGMIVWQAGNRSGFFPGIFFFLLREA